MRKNAYPSRSNRRLPFPRDGVGFLGARPRRHRDGNRFERLGAVAAKLEMRADQDRDRDTCGHLDDLLALAELAPRRAAASKEVPDLLDGATGDGSRHGFWLQAKDGHAAVPRRAQQADLGAIRGY